jgi:hypothetical protein
MIVAWNKLTALLSGTVLLGFVASSTGVAKGQANCEAIPAGRARTDCYIGLSHINRQRSAIAAGAAQQQTNRAIYRQVTGMRPKTKRHRAVSGQ